MLILGIDTAASGCGVALTEGETPLVECVERVGRTHSARLMPLVEAALDAAGRGRADVEGIAVTVGPGSHTGLRIGLATAKALAFGLGVPAAGVGTLEALAYGAGPRPGLVCPLLDARRGRVYTALYRWEDGRLSEVEGPRLAEAADWFAGLAGRNRDVLFTGDGVAVHGPAAAEIVGARAALAPPFAAGVRPAAVAALGFRRLAREPRGGPEALVPLYLGAAPAGGGCR